MNRTAQSTGGHHAGCPEDHYPNNNPVTFLIAFLTALVVFLAYLPVLKYGFTNWDDPDYTLENLHIRSMDFGFFKWVFTSASVSNWHPLTIISYALDYRIWGLNPTGYHLTSIVFHALNTALVFLLSVRLAGFLPEGCGNGLKKFILPLVAALLFGLHPLHVESVAWVAERKDVLCGFFYMLSVLFYLEYSSSRKTSAYIAAFILFVLALMSKPMAISLPFALLLLDFYPLGRLQKEARTAALEKIPFFMFSGVSAYLTIWAQKADGAIMTIAAYPLHFRIDTVVRACVFYLYKMILPINLAPFYPLTLRPDYFNRVFYIYAAVFMAITAFCVLAAKRRRVFLTAWLFYLVTLGPVSGLVQVGGQAAADRYTYLPLLGPFFLAGLGAQVLFNRLNRKVLKDIATGIITAALVVLTVLTVKQAAVWKDSLTLWSHEIRLYPGRAPRAHLNRGLAYQDRGDLQKAIEDYTFAIRLDPDNAEAYNNRGVVHRLRGNYGLAVRDILIAISINPQLATAYYNLGVAYQEVGETEYALKALEKAKELGY